jgi:hypothetical protein
MEKYHPQLRKIQMANGIGGRRGQCRLTEDNIEPVEFGEALALRKRLGKRLSTMVRTDKSVEPRQM